MSPLAAVALAREQGVSTVVHVSCRDRNRMALQSQVVGAAALGSEGVLCLYGDAVEGVPRVKDLTATSLIAKAKEWAQPHELAVGAVVNPFAPDLRRELRLLERKLAAGVDFLQSQMVFDLDALERFFVAASDLLSGVRFYAGVGVLRTPRMADNVRRLPGCLLPEAADRRIRTGGGVTLAVELAAELAAVPGVDALHVYPLGAEVETRDVSRLAAPRQRWKVSTSRVPGPGCESRSQSTRPATGSVPTRSWTPAFLSSSSRCEVARAERSARCRS